MSYQDERDCAVAAVLDACRLCTVVRAALISEETLAKKDRSPVTVADFGAQAVVNKRLAEIFPGDGIVAEEDASALRTDDGADIRGKVIEQAQRVHPDLTADEVLDAIDRGDSPGGATGRHWVLDPIDGTKGFLRGDQYAVALALMVDGEVVLGVLGCPNLALDAADPRSPRGCLFIATKGDGTVMRPLDATAETPVRVAPVGHVREARVCESVEAGHSAHDDAARIIEQLGITVSPYRIDSQCKYAAIARGDASIYLRLPTRKDYEEKIWDHAAGYLAVTEAGGQVSDVRGRPLDFSLGRTLRANKGAVATTRSIHEPVIAAVRDVLGY